MQDVRDALTGEFGAECVLIEPAAMMPFLDTWFHDETGAAIAVLRPRNVAEVQAMVRACARLGVGIVPQGGNTGLVGGALPRDAEAHVCLSLGRLNRIRSMEPDDYSAVVEAGCILQSVKDAAAEHDLFLPVSIGAQGTAQIGGIVSTNAGGINVLRWGMTRDQVLGLEVVLPDGSLWDGLSTLRKNNTGPDLKQLFIGAEGTFGIITAAAMRLVPWPTSTAAALIGMPDIASTMRTFHRARRDCSDMLSAFEFLMPRAMEIAQENLIDAPRLDTEAGTYALVELAAPGPIDLRAILESFLEGALNEGIVTDGIVAASEAQARHIWALREAVNEGQARRGPFLRSDVSVRLGLVPEFVTETCAAIETQVPGAETVAYGHFGDGNVHLNVIAPLTATPDEAADIFHRAKDVLNAAVDRRSGSISAEHGIGRMKRADLHDRLPAPSSRLLAGLKTALDPEGLMNPGALHL